MANLKQDLKNIEEQMEQLDELIQSHCIAWAQEHTSGLEKEKLPEDIGLLLSDLEALENKASEIEALVEELNEIKDKQTRVKDSESEENRARGDFYQVLGRRSFDLYKKGTLADSEGLDELFRPLLEWEDKIRNADNELYRIRSEQEDKSFFKKMGAFIKKSSQSTIKKNAGDNLNKHYKKAGERLIKEGYFNAIAQNGLSDIYEDFQNKEETTRKLREEQQTLSGREEELESRLNELCGGNKPPKALKLLKEENSRMDGELDSAYLRLGQTLYSGKDPGEPYRKLVDELKKEREEKNREKIVCVTGIRIQELDEDLQKKQKETDQQQEKAEKEQLKWESLKSETDELLKKKIQLEKEREDLGYREKSDS